MRVRHKDGKKGSGRRCRENKAIIIGRRGSGRTILRMRLHKCMRAVSCFMLYASCFTYVMGG